MPGELRKRETTRVRVAPLVRREMVRSLSTATTVESELEITLYPRTAGIVTALLVEEGDRVAEGAELVRLDAREQEAALAEAEIEAQEAKDDLLMRGLTKQETHERWERSKLTHEQAVRDYERNEKTGLISQQDLDRLRLSRDTAQRDVEGARLLYEVTLQAEKNAETAIDRAELAVESARLQLSYTRLVAPFSGVIARRNVKVGDSVSNATAAFVLTDPERLRSVFHRPQRELPIFRAALEATAEGGTSAPIEIRLTSEALPGEVFVGTIRMVSPTIDVSSGSFRITVDLAQPEDGRQRLLPGMLVRLAVVTDRHPDALVVPKRALLREGETTYVFAIEDGKAHRVEVREGFADDEHVEIVAVKSGSLSENDSIVVVGNRDLEEDVVVEAEPWVADEKRATDVVERRVGDEAATESTEDSKEEGGEASDEESGDDSTSEASTDDSSQGGTR